MESPLPADKKLTVTFRVEPGCLGPDGKSLIEAFCSYAQQDIKLLDLDYVNWHITPRFDKSLPEIQYNIHGKRISHDQANKYIALFGKQLSELEEHLDDRLTSLIDSFTAA